jgi:hypothetical protein
MHICGGGHNDALVAFFVLAGFLLYRKDHQLWGVALVTLAVMFKLTAALALLPLLVLYLRDKRGKPLPGAAKAAAVVGAVTVVSYLPFWDGMKIFKSAGNVSKLYSFSSIPRLISIEIQRVLVKTGMTGNRAESLSDSAVRLAFLVIFVLVTMYLLTRVKDYRSMITSTAEISLVWFLTSAYILPWYLALGLMVACVAGWNFSTGAFITVASVFTLYHVPETRLTRLSWTNRLGADPYLSVPFLLTLLVWLVVGLGSLVKRNRARTKERSAAEALDEA